MQENAALPDRTWALCSAVALPAGVLGYALVVALHTSAPVSALLVCVFGAGLIVGSIGLHLGVTRTVAPRLGLLAAVAMVAAVVELMAMALVQLAVKAAVPHPGAAMTGIWLGLDVAWDVFGAAGTILFGLALWHHAGFRPLTALAGVLAAAVLLVLNLATFPTPPAEAGLVDVGPLVALWYVVLGVRVLLVARSSARAQLAPDGNAVLGTADAPPLEREAMAGALTD